LYALRKHAMIVFMLQQPTSPTEYAMHKTIQPFHLNKPFALICLFTMSTLAASLLPADGGADAAPAPVAREAGTIPCRHAAAMPLRCHPIASPSRHARLDGRRRLAGAAAARPARPLPPASAHASSRNSCRARARIPSSKLPSR
jgi:hypothetical protein